MISYEGLSRIETYPFPEPALREALLNAHKDYGSGNPVQISVYEDRIIFWNEGQLPDDWTVERLKQKHPSKPYNPDIANTLFRAGLIEAWGRGTIKIMSECKKLGLPDPVFKYDLSGFMIEFKGRMVETSGKTSGKIVQFIKESPEITIPQLASLMEITERSIERSIQKLQKENKIERVGPAKGGHWRVID
jgi:ATP-dependent DNA helicase RecG